jgi:hypothetical protein
MAGLDKNAVMPGLVPGIHVCAPGMGIDLEVEILW